MNGFQVMPELSEADFSALKSDIAERGVMVPIEYDEAGDVIDGHHRIRACDELGIKEWPRVVRIYEDDLAKRTQARRLNIARRHLDTAAKRALIEAELKDRPEVSNRMIAGVLGIHHETVAAVRGELESTGEIRQLDRTVGRDGKERTTSPARRPQLSSFDFGAGSGDKHVRGTLGTGENEWYTPESYIELARLHRETTRGANMAKNKAKKYGAGSSAPKRNAETISDDQLYWLTEQHRQKYEIVLEAKKKANKALIDLGKIIKSDLGAKGLQDIRDLIALDTPEGEAAMKAEMERQARVMRWMNIPIGTQGGLFADADRTPITERAFNEGKRQGLAGEPVSNPHHHTTEAARKHDEGFAEGQKTLATKGFSKLYGALSKDEWASRTAEQNAAVSEAIKTGTVSTLGDKAKAAAAADSLAEH